MGGSVRGGVGVGVGVRGWGVEKGQKERPGEGALLYMMSNPIE